MAEPSFWERPEIVARFGERAPDRRLVEIVTQQGAQGLACLDLGCAAGRNTRYLAEQGADVHALDASRAMVEAARRQVADVLGPAEAERRVRLGRMDRLDAFENGRFDLVLLLGVLQNAGTEDELERTLDGVRRVLAPGARCLVANFAPDSRPAGAPLSPVAGEAHVFEGFGGPHRRITLLTPDELDAAFHARGLEPLAPSTPVHVPTERGHRTTVNALYRLPAA